MLIKARTYKLPQPVYTNPLTLIYKWKFTAALKAIFY
jgi:hypothetical protein